jgi:hypothetical protein
LLHDFPNLFAPQRSLKKLGGSLSLLERQIGKKSIRVQLIYRFVNDNWVEGKQKSRAPGRGGHGFSLEKALVMGASPAW